MCLLLACVSSCARCRCLLCFCSGVVASCCCCSSCCCSCCPVDDKSAFTYFDRVPYTERAVGQRIEVGAQRRNFCTKIWIKVPSLKFSCWAKLACLRSLISYIANSPGPTLRRRTLHGNSFQQFAKEAKETHLHVKFRQMNEIHLESSRYYHQFL